MTAQLEVPKAIAETPDRAGGAATTGSGRVGNVDALRAGAALTVLIGHAYQLSGRAIPIQAERWYDILLAATTSGVWLFFAISGYVISRPFIRRLVNGDPLPELVPYALKRGLRIFPLYWIALTAFVILAGLGTTELWQLGFHFALLQNLVPGEQTALLTVAWTLTLEVLFYVAVPILALAIRRFRPRVTPEWVAVLVLLSWAASIAFTELWVPLGASETGIWLRGSFPAMWQMFCPGILLTLLPYMGSPIGHRVRRALASRWAIPAAMGLLGVAAILYAAAPLRYGIAPYVAMVDLSRPLFAAGFGIILAGAIRARPWEARFGDWILRLGLVSYGIYMLQAIVGTVVLNEPGSALLPLPEDTLLAFFVHTMFLGGLTIPLAFASWKFLERPSIELASALSDRWRDRRGGGNVDPSGVGSGLRR